MNSKMMAAIAILVLLVLGGVYYWHSQKAVSQQQPTTSPASAATSDTQATKIYEDSKITFVYPSTLFVATDSTNDADRNHVALVTKADASSTNGEIQIDESLKTPLDNFDQAVAAFQKEQPTFTKKDVDNGVIFSGPNKNVAFVKDKKGAIRIENDQYTPILDDQAFTQFIATFNVIN